MARRTEDEDDLAEDEDDATPERVTRPETAKLVRFVLKVLFRHPVLLAGSAVAGILVVLTELASITLILPFLEALRGSPGTVSQSLPFAGLMPDLSSLSTEETIRFIAVGLVVVQLARGVFAYIEGRLANYQKVLFERDLRQMVFDELLRVQIGFIHNEKIANLYTVMHSYPRRAAGLVLQFLGTASKTLLFVAYAWFMFALSWQLTLLAAGLGAVSMLGVRWIRVSLRRLARRMNESTVRLNQVSLESLAAMKVIRLFGRERHARAKFLSEVRRLQRDSFKSASLSALAAPLQRLLHMMLFAALLVTATYVLQRSAEDWILLLTVFMLVLMRLMTPMANLTKRQTKISEELPALEEIVEFVEREKPYLADGEREFDGFRRGVRFDDVSFAYARDGPPALRGVSFELPKGKTVALVGGSGSGKSTLVNLLARLADPTSGRITVDGADLRDHRAETWRRRIAVVSQDAFLFNASVRENIRFGRLDATDAEVEAAARKANAHDFILAMEQGYDTTMGDRGVRLSGGQAQRIAIARALLADPDILVLDEATSALDAETENVVQRAIEEAARGRTVLAVAHRLATVRHADEIVVLENGEIVERGTHAELLARRGKYHDYVRMQSLGAAPEPAA